MMTNLEKLENEIRLKLPRLMEFSDGCMFKYKPIKDLSIKFDAKIHLVSGGTQIADTGDYDDVYVDFYSDYNGFENLPIDEIENYEIIGHEIKLNDVLEWFRNKNMVDNRYVTISFTEREGFIRLGISSDDHYLIGYWDLSKNLLKDQNQELINNLSELIPQ